MSEKKRPEKTSPLPELKSTVTEILVANGRSFQPFIRTFSYTGENVSKVNLGTLIGVFEIDELSEDCAYIVNFLASVAKKEYFNNPRRGAIESFEAALHKINLALSELVKHGNVAWLGKLHGTLAVLEKNNLHFSVTGEAKILLLRNDGLSDISDGLASLESHQHPIKTFVEVSSGRLMADDRVILTSPELLALFSVDELTKNARRMNPGQFLQFLRTALVNELDMSGVLLVEVAEGTTAPVARAPKRSAEEKSLERVQNIFSQAAFLQKNQGGSPSTSETLPPPEEPLPTEPSIEYTDTKTGHIYIQGAATGEANQHPGIERMKLSLEETYDGLRSLVLSQGKWFRKGKKSLLAGTEFCKEQGRALGRKGGRLLRRLWRKQQLLLKKTLEKKAAIPAAFPRQEKQAPSIPVTPLPEAVQKPPLTPQPLAPEPPIATPSVTSEDSELPPFIREKVAFFYQRESVSVTQESLPRQKDVPANTPDFLSKGGALIKKWAERCSAWPTKLSRALLMIKEALSNTASWFLSLFQKYPRKYVLLGSLGILVCLVLFGFLLFKSKTPAATPTTPEEESNASPHSITSQSIVAPSPDMTVLLENAPGPIVATVVLNDQVYAITESTIVATLDGKTFPLPAGAKAKFATAMDDLRLIFVYTRQGTLYAWSPISKTFVENTLPLDGQANITGIDTYLTYLYVLDSTTDQVYRFPRADGGFGSGTSWLKENVAVEATSHLAVNETLFIAPDTTTIKGFFHGRGSNTFEIPAEGLEITDLYTHPGLENVYALDRERKLIVIWNQDGHFLQEFYHDKLALGQTLSVNEKTHEVFVGAGTTLFSFRLR